MTVYEEIRGRLPTSGCGRREDAPFGVVEVSGPDAVDFLHRLSSQDVAGLAEGCCAPAAFLTSKGKLIATATIVRGAGRLWVETQAHVVGDLLELLDRYHFTEQLALRRRDDWTAVDVVGVEAPPAGLAPGAAEVADDGIVLAGARRGVAWERCHGTPARAATWRDDLPVLATDLAECLRIAGGLVRIGVDTEASTLAPEADLDDHVSTTKGCYTGQEIIARIHTYGHVNRRIALLRLEEAGAIESGTPLCDPSDGEPLGRVMSAVVVPGSDASIGLGYLPEVFLSDPEPLGLGSAGGARVQVEPFAPA